MRNRATMRAVPAMRISLLRQRFAWIEGLECSPKQGLQLRLWGRKCALVRARVLEKRCMWWRSYDFWMCGAGIGSTAASAAAAADIAVTKAAGRGSFSGAWID